MSETRRKFDEGREFPGAHPFKRPDVPAFPGLVSTHRFVE
jgi:hypothetical protein